MDLPSLRRCRCLCHFTITTATTAAAILDPLVRFGTRQILVHLAHLRSCHFPFQLKVQLLAQQIKVQIKEYSNEQRFAP